MPLSSGNFADILKGVRVPYKNGKKIKSSTKPKGRVKNGPPKDKRLTKNR